MNVDVKEYLPLLIPLIAVQFSLLAYTIVHILRHKSYKRGSRTLWLIVSIVGMEFIGPILYFILGKEED
ncbi:MAG: PLDc N-terminal domain-containing protein [Ruminococcus sp.]|nr:PLDc N-terminal domain-containing protein [Ruminococcus sp.]